MTVTATAIIVWGGIPIFSEIDHNTYCLDINKIEEKITKKTRAIIFADIFGQLRLQFIKQKLQKNIN